MQLVVLVQGRWRWGDDGGGEKSISSCPVNFGVTEPRSSWCPVAHRRGEDVPRHSPQHQTPRLTMIQSDTRLGSEKNCNWHFFAHPRVLNVPRERCWAWETSR